MADNIQFRVDAVLGDTTMLRQQIQSLKTNLTLTINNTQALQSIKQVQTQINNLRSSMANINLGAIGGATGGNGGRGGTNNGGTTGHILNANQQFQTSVTSANSVQSVINNLNSQIDGTVSKLRLCTDETGRIVGGTAEITKGATTWVRNIEQARDVQGNIIEGQYILTEQGRAIVDNTNKYNGSLTQQLKMQFKQYAMYYAVSSIIKGITESISNTVNYAVDLNDALTNIRVVTMDTKDATEDLLKMYNQMGQELGASTLDIAEGAVDWLRQGFSQEDTAKLVEASTIASKLALIDNAEATEYLTSALKGYKLEAEDAISVIDMMTAVDLEAATSAGDMFEALSRTANMARTTGFEMNEVVGMIATMSEVTQNSASTIGNSVKTILSRMSNVAAGKEIDEMGEPLNDVEETLNRVGIALRNSNNEWYDFYDVLDEIASRWDDFSDAQKSQITTALGGTRQRENILVALENWDKVKQYAETGANSQGTAMEKYGIILESVSAKQAQLTAKVEEFKNNILDDDMVSGVLELGKGFMDVINFGDGLVAKLLLITTSAITLSAILTALSKNGTRSFNQLIVSVLGLATAEGTATAGATALSTALNVLKSHPIIFALSILTTIIVGVTSAINAHNEAIQESIDKANELTEAYKSSRQELQDNLSSLKKGSGSYKTLQEEFDELCKGVDKYGNNISLTSEQYERYKSICEQIVDLNPDLMDGYDSATEAINNQSSALKTTIDYLKEKARLEAQEYADDSEEKAKAYKEQYDKETEDARNILNEDDWKIKGGIATNLNNAKNEISNINSQITSEINQLIQDGKKSEADALQQQYLLVEDIDEMLSAPLDVILADWQNYKAKLEQIMKSPKANDALKGYITQFINDIEKNALIISEAKDKFNDNIQPIFDSVLNASEIYGESDSNTRHYLKEWIINSEIFDIDPNDPDYNTKIDEAKKSINDILSKIGTLSDSQKQQMSKALDTAFNIDDLIINVDYNKFETKIRDVINTISQMTNQSFDEVATSLNLDIYFNISSDGYKELQGVYNQTKLLNQAQNELNNSGKVSQSTINSMQGSFDNLQSYLSKTKNGYVLTQQGLEHLTVAMQTQYEVALNEAKQGALNVLDQEHKKGLSYESTTKAIKEQLEAQVILAKADYGKLGIGGGGLHLYKPYTDALDALQELEEADAKYNASRISLSGAGSGGTTNKQNNGSGGSGSKSSSSKKEWWEKQLEKLKDQLEYNSITMDTYINGIEKILKKLKKGSSAWKEVNAELQKAKLDNVKNQFSRGEITIDQYITKLTKLRKSYKKNTEGYKELTEEINKSKANKWADQYERGKISADTYIKKLEELRKTVKVGSEAYKEYTDLINKTKLDKAEKYIEKLRKKIDNLNDKISRLGNVNTNSERKSYAKLKSEELTTVKSNQSDIKTQLDADKKYDDAVKRRNNLLKKQQKYKKGSKEYKNIQKLINAENKYINKHKADNLTAEQRNALQKEYNQLLIDEVEIRDEIEDAVREYYENQKEQLEQQAELNKKQKLYNKEVELYGEKGKDVFEWETNKKIEALEKEKELREAERDALDQVNEREELENDLLEARLKLQNALNNKTTKILTKQDDGTWAYTFSANMSDVKSAQEEIKNAEDAINDYEFEQEMQKIQDQIDELQKTIDDKATAYEDYEFWVERDYEATINGIEQAFGNIDALVQNWLATYGKTDTDLTKNYQKLTESNNSLITSITNLTTAINGKYETTGVNSVTPQNGITSFDTGGEIKGSGLAFVHNKERVLTQEQNANFTKLLNNIDDISKLIDIAKINIPNLNYSNGIGLQSKNTQSIVINGVTCNFPAVTSPDGIQDAILSLPRLAVQYSKKK